MTSLPIWINPKRSNLPKTAWSHWQRMGRRNGGLLGCRARNCPSNQTQQHIAQNLGQQTQQQHYLYIGSIFNQTSSRANSQSNELQSQSNHLKITPQRRVQWWTQKIGCTFFSSVFTLISPLTVCIFGCWVRFDTSRYTWKPAQAKCFNLAICVWQSNLFHIGILIVLLGHLFGMFTPRTPCMNTLSPLAKTNHGNGRGWRGRGRVFVWFNHCDYPPFSDPRISHTSTFGDKALLIILLAQLLLGLGTILCQWTHGRRDDDELGKLGSKQRFFALCMLPHWLSKLGLCINYICSWITTLILLVPFTRLIHYLCTDLVFGQTLSNRASKSAQ